MTPEQTDTEPLTTEDVELVEHVSILEYNEDAPDYDDHATPGGRVVVGGVRRNQHVRDDDKEGFVKVAEAVAIIELHQQIPEDDVTDWCNSPAGKLALAHWFDYVDPEDVVMT